MRKPAGLPSGGPGRLTTFSPKPGRKRYSSGAGSVTFYYHRSKINCPDIATVSRLSAIAGEYRRAPGAKWVASKDDVNERERRADSHDDLEDDVCDVGFLAAQATYPRVSPDILLLGFRQAHLPAVI